MKQLSLALLIILLCVVGCFAQSDTCATGDTLVVDTSTKTYKCVANTVLIDANKIQHRNSAGVVISGVATEDSSGNISTTGALTTGSGGSVAGNLGLAQGTVTSVATNTI